MFSGESGIGSGNSRPGRPTGRLDLGDVCFFRVREFRFEPVCIPLLPKTTSRHRSLQSDDAGAGVGHNFNFVARRKTQGQTLNLYIVEQRPVIAPAGYDRPRARARPRPATHLHHPRLGPLHLERIGAPPHAHAPPGIPMWSGIVGLREFSIKRDPIPGRCRENEGVGGEPGVGIVDDAAHSRGGCRAGGWPVLSRRVSPRLLCKNRLTKPGSDIAVSRIPLRPLVPAPAGTPFPT